MPIRLRTICLAALCAMLSSTAMLLFSGIAAACSGTGGGGGCPAPSVSTGGATSITSNNATLNGSVNPQGCYTEYAFEYGRSSEGYPNEIGSSAGSGTSPVSVQTYSALGLQPSTSYHFRLTAWSSGGETTGGSSSFTTPAACPKPTVTTGTASSITPYSATMNGTVNPQGCETMYKFEWGPSSSPGTYPYLQSGFTGKETSSINISKPASVLEPGKSYHFRVSASSQGGTATPGGDKPFTATPLTDYVALGDSYSAGTGTRLFVDAVCRESIHSYPYLLHNAYPGLKFVDNACHGAETSNLLSQASALTEKTKWATYTIGGNDAGFKGVLEACGIFAGASCADALKKAKSFIEGTLSTRLDTVNHLIKLEAKWAKVFVLDYPHIFNGEDCNLATLFFEADMKEMNKLSDLLSEKLHKAALKAGSNFHFASVITLFNGHAVCDGGSGSATEWINGYSSPKEESYHPKIEGHRAGYFSALLSAIFAFG